MIVAFNIHFFYYNTAYKGKRGFRRINWMGNKRFEFDKDAIHTDLTKWNICIVPSKLTDWSLNVTDLR